MDPCDELKGVYPALIAQMPPHFMTREFILKLAHQHQALYIRVLAKYIDTDYPFQKAHSYLARVSDKFSHVLHLVGEEPSTGIFGYPGTAKLWKKK